MTPLPQRQPTTTKTKLLVEAGMDPAAPCAFHDPGGLAALCLCLCGAEDAGGLPVCVYVRGRWVECGACIHGRMMLEEREGERRGGWEECRRGRGGEEEAF